MDNIGVHTGPQLLRRLRQEAQGLSWAFLLTFPNGCGILVQVFRSRSYLHRVHGPLVRAASPNQQLIAACVRCSADSYYLWEGVWYDIPAVLNFTREYLGAGTISHEATHAASAIFQHQGKKSLRLNQDGLSTRARRRSPEEQFATLVGEITRGVCIGLQRRGLIP